MISLLQQLGIRVSRTQDDAYLVLRKSRERAVFGQQLIPVFLQGEVETCKPGNQRITIVQHINFSAIQEGAILPAGHFNPLACYSHFISSDSFPGSYFEWSELSGGPSKAAQVDPFAFLVRPKSSRKQPRACNRV